MLLNFEKNFNKNVINIIFLKYYIVVLIITRNTFYDDILAFI